MEPTTAYYSRDEVSGPLGSAQGNEDGQQQTLVRKVRETTEVVEGTASR